MKKRLILGIVALAGGYLGKKYLDKQIANPNNFYDDYKDALIGEGGKVILKGLKGTAEGLSLGYEKLFKEPKFNDELDEEACERRIKARQETCPHLNGQVLAPRLAQNERFALAKLSREEHFDIFFDEVEDSPLERAQNEASKLSKLLDEIYALESECFKTSEALRALAKSLQGFGFDTKELCEYSVSASKYDIDYDLGALKEIQLMKEHLQGVREMLNGKMIVKEIKGDKGALFDEARQIHRLITSDFVDGVFWISAEESIRRATKMADSDENERARIIKMADSDENEWVVPNDCFGIPRFIKRKNYFAPNDEVQNAIKAEFSSNADENKPNDKA